MNAAWIYLHCPQQITSSISLNFKLNTLILIIYFFLKNTLPINDKQHLLQFTVGIYNQLT